MFIGLNEKDWNLLEMEIVPNRARLQLTRLIRQAVATDEDSVLQTTRMNCVVNICRNALGLSLSQIELNDYGVYEYVDYGWIHSEIELSMRRPTTPELVETLIDLVLEDCLSITNINEVLSENGCSFCLGRTDVRTVWVDISPVEQIEADAGKEIVNIRMLIQRMDVALREKDYAGVLHASASVFETLAKDVVSSNTVQNQTLASFFDRYRRDSNLPAPVLDYILEVYKHRNLEPLAGHGSLTPPSITKENAVVLCELTKAIIRMERQLSDIQISKKIEKSL